MDIHLLFKVGDNPNEELLRRDVLKLEPGRRVPGPLRDLGAQETLGDVPLQLFELLLLLGQLGRESAHQAAQPFSVRRDLIVDLEFKH